MFKDVSKADMDQLYAKLTEKKWEKIHSVLQLRRHLKDYGLLRRIVASLWIAVIYLAVDQASRERACHIISELQRAQEIGNKGFKEKLSKYQRAGRASWKLISKLDPGVLALVELAEPISEMALDALLCRTDLVLKGIPYREHVSKVFDYFVEFLEEKQVSVFRLFKNPLDELEAAVSLKYQRVKATLLKHEPTCDGLGSGSGSVATPGKRSDITTIRSTSPRSSAGEPVSSISSCNDVQGFFSDRSSVSHSPSPPQALLVSENLFHNINVYFENSCRNMIFDDHGTLLAPNGAKLNNDLCSHFDSYCFTATMLIENGLHVEFGRALSKASALVEPILRAEHPRTLACFLEVFMHLIQTGLPAVTSSLRDFIKSMSAKIITKGHPWGQICQLLGELDPESLDQAIAQTWKCTTDIFDRVLGTLHRFAVSVRLDYIKRVYGITDYHDEEQHLRRLLAQFGDIPGHSTPRVMLNLAHNLNRQGHHDEAEKIAQEVRSLLQKHKKYAGRIVESIESLKSVSLSQFNQGKILVAVQNMQEAIRMIVDQWGIQHSWVPEFMIVLEGWLRDWGREEDAKTLRGKIEELIGKDESDKQLDGVQGLVR